MRILFFSHYFHPEGNAPATRVYELTRRWAKAGHDVTVITGVPNVPNGVAYEGYRNRLSQTEELDGVRVRRVWTWLAANRGTVRRTANFLSYMVSASLAGLGGKRPDVVIATSPQFFCGWAGLIVSRLRRLPFVLEIRDIWPASIQAVEAIGSGRVIRLLEAMERRMYAGARHVVTVGDGYRRELEQRGVPAERITVIPNGVDRAAFAPRAPDPEWKKRLGVDGRFVCAYVGTIGMACGLDVVIRAARRLRDSGRGDIAFLLVGDGAVRGDLERQARAEGLANVIFTGRMDKESIPAVLGSSDACLVHLKRAPLFETVLPSKIFEAAAMAKPVVLGVRGEAARLVREAGAGICIEPEDDAQLAAAVEQLAADPAQCRALGEAGLRTIVPRFDYENLAGEYLALLGRVLAPASAGAGGARRDE